MTLALHPAITRALQLAAEDAPAAAAAAAQLLPRALRPLLSSPRPAEAWSFSALSQEGFPQEFAFTSFDRTLRYTVEVAGPETPPAARLAHTRRLWRRLGAPALPRALVARLARLHAGATLRYGAWLGVRHGPDSPAYKLYAELPPTARAAAWEQGLHDAPPAVLGRARLRMLGCDRDRLELYYDIHHLQPGEIEALLCRGGSGGRAPEVLTLLEQAYRRPVRRELPATKLGFSYALPLDGRGPIVTTIYHFCSSLFGGDGRTRRALLRLLDELGWPQPFYEKLSAPLAERRGFRCCHGMFGVVIRPGLPLGITFGLAPPMVASC